MFEVDWADYDCERVGERRARKENEKKEKKKRDDTSSNHESISTRTSRSSDHQHRSFFGTLGRKKQISSPSSSRKGRQQSGTAKLRKPDEKLKRTLSSNLGSTTSSLPPPPDEHLREPSISEAPREPSISEALREPSISEAPPIPPRHPAHAHDAGSSAAASMDRTRPGSPDRSSKESMLSKMTQLTIPNPEPQGDGPTAEAAGTTTSLIRALNDEEPEVPPQPASEPPQADGDSVSADTCPEPEVKTASSPRTPRTPTSPRPTHIMAFPDNGRPASDIIDDWFTALHGPNRQLPRRGPNGTIRRGHVLLPPTLSRPLPTTPTRHSAASDSFSPPRPSSIRFLVDNPNHWKTPGEWGGSFSSGAPDPAQDSVPAVKHHQAAMREPPRGSMDSMAVNVGCERIKQHGCESTRSSCEGKDSVELLRDKSTPTSPVSCQFVWNLPLRERSLATTPSI